MRGKKVDWGIISALAPLRNTLRALETTWFESPSSEERVGAGHSADGVPRQVPQSPGLPPAGKVRTANRRAGTRQSDGGTRREFFSAIALVLEQGHDLRRKQLQRVEHLAVFNTPIIDEEDQILNPGLL